MDEKSALLRFKILGDLLRLVGRVVVRDDMQDLAFGRLSVKELEKCDGIFDLVRVSANADDRPGYHIQCHV